MKGYLRRSKMRLRLAWTYALPVPLLKDGSHGVGMERTAELPVTHVFGLQCFGVFCGVMVLNKRGVETRDEAVEQEARRQAGG